MNSLGCDLECESINHCGGAVVCEQCGREFCPLDDDDGSDYGLCWRCFKKYRDELENENEGIEE